MQFRARAGVSVVIALAMMFAGCQAAQQEKSMVEFKKNPAPKKAYQIKATIANAPGSFAIVKGFMQYDVVNHECTSPPKTQPGGVNAPVPTDDIPFEVTKISDTEYVGTIYMDGMVDEDYYGYGVCRWGLSGASILFKTSDSPKATTFQANFFSEDIAAGKSQTSHFPKSVYPSNTDWERDHYVSSGMSDKLRARSSLKDEDLFTVVITAKGDAP